MVVLSNIILLIIIWRMCLSISLLVAAVLVGREGALTLRSKRSMRTIEWNPLDDPSAIRASPTFPEQQACIPAARTFRGPNCGSAPKSLRQNHFAKAWSVTSSLKLLVGHFSSTFNFVFLSKQNKLFSNAFCAICLALLKPEAFQPKTFDLQDAKMYRMGSTPSEGLAKPYDRSTRTSRLTAKLCHTCKR